MTSSLLAGALIELGVRSKSWLNWQIPILTEGEHSNSRIININIKEINILGVFDANLQVAKKFSEGLTQNYFDLRNE